VLAIAQAIGAQHMPARLEALLDGDPAIAAAAALELSLAYPDRAIELLGTRVPDLADAPEDVGLAITLIAAQAEDAAVSLYVQATRSGDLDVAFDCVGRLGEVGSPRSTAALIKLLDMPQPMRRWVMLALQGSEDPGVLDALETVIFSDESRRWTAVDVLEEISTGHALEAVDRVMRSTSPLGLVAAEYLFSKTEDADAWRTLSAVLNTGSWTERVFAAAALAGHAVPGADEVLSSALSEAPLEDRVSAAKALLSRDPHEVAMSALEEIALGETPLDVAITAVDALTYGPSETAVGILQNLIENAPDAIALHAAAVLFDLGVDEAFEYLLEAAIESDEAKAAVLVEAIEETPPEGLLPPVERLLRNGSARERRIAGQLLASASDDERGLDLAIEFIDDDEPAVRLGAVSLLTYDDSEASEAVLAERLERLLTDHAHPWDGSPYEPVFTSVADTTYYALERRPGLLKRGLDRASAPLAS
jgi:hypothetical protein